jgi:hypothetical protein
VDFMVKFLRLMRIRLDIVIFMMFDDIFIKII